MTGGQVEANLICVFCHRPITAEFAYRKPSAANGGLCTRKDCRKNRKRISKEAEKTDEGVSAASVLRQETGFEEGDASTDFNKDAPEKHHEVVVKSDLDDDSVPLLAKIRMRGMPTTNDLLSRLNSEVSATERVPKQPRRAVINPIADSRSCWGEGHTSHLLHEKVQWLEECTPSKMHMKEEQPADDEAAEKADTDKIRDAWLKDKFYEDESNRVVLEKLPAIPDLCFGNYFNLRKAVELSVEQLAAFIADEKFKEPIKGKSERKSTTAISRREACFYKDYAAGEAFTVEQLIERHGAWTDEEIEELEFKIIVHAARVGLLVLAPGLLPQDHTHYFDDEGDQAATIFKTGGAEIGGGITVKKREDGRRRNLTDFETRPPTDRYDPEKPYVAPSGEGMFDDYNTEKD